MEKKIGEYVTIGQGIRGFYAMLVGIYTDKGQEYHDTIQTGIDSYEFRTDAIKEAKEWAMADGIEFKL
jgi:hypothetical protein